MLKSMVQPAAVVLVASPLLAGCASAVATFSDAAPGAALEIPARELRPAGPGPVPARLVRTGEAHACTTPRQPRIVHRPGYDAAVGAAARRRAGELFGYHRRGR